MLLLLYDHIQRFKRSIHRNFNVTWTKNLILFLRAFYFIFFQFLHHLFELSLRAFVSTIHWLNLLLEAFQEILELGFWHFHISSTRFIFILQKAALVLISVIYKVFNHILHRVCNWKMVDIEITNLVVLCVIFILNLLKLIISHLSFIFVIFQLLRLHSLLSGYICSTLSHLSWNICSLWVCEYNLVVLIGFWVFFG